MQGGEHLQFLVKNNLVSITPSTDFDKIYTTKLEKITGLTDKEAKETAADVSSLTEESMLLKDSKAKEVNYPFSILFSSFQTFLHSRN